MEAIFSTKERIKILEAIIFKKDTISVNNVANQLKLSKGLVSKYIGLLAKAGITRKKNGKCVIADSPLVKGTRILLNIKNTDSRIFKRHAFVKSVGLYGSCAKGENTEDSDVDLWIKTEETSDEKLAALSSELNKRIKNARLLFLTDKKLEKLKKKDELFYHSLAFGSVIIYGEGNDVQL